MKVKNLTEILIEYFHDKPVIGLDVFSDEEAADALAEYLEQYVQTKPWEGKMHKGVFYLKQPDGRYYSVTTMKYLSKKQEHA